MQAWELRIRFVQNLFSKCRVCLDVSCHIICGSFTCLFYPAVMILKTALKSVFWTFYFTESIVGLNQSFGYETICSILLHCVMPTKTKKSHTMIITLMIILKIVYCRNIEKGGTDKFPTVLRNYRCLTEKLLEIARKKPFTKTSLWWVFCQRFSEIFENTCFLEHLWEAASVSDLVSKQNPTF